MRGLDKHIRKFRRASRNGPELVRRKGGIEIALFIQIFFFVDVAQGLRNAIRNVRQSRSKRLAIASSGRNQAFLFFGPKLRGLVPVFVALNFHKRSEIKTTRFLFG
jgi:hypothetical protein